MHRGDDPESRAADTPALVAHRGFAGEHAENTVPAIRAASEVADTVEIDVRRSGSGDLVACHDARVDDLTDGSGRVAALATGTLADLDVLGSGAGVPTLAAALRAVADGVAVVLDCKERGVAADAVALARAAGVEVLVSSFLRDPLYEAGAADPSVPRAYLVSDDGPLGLDTALALGCDALHPHWDLCTEGDLIDRAHAAGLRVNAWTVDSATVGTRLARLGVDGVIADRPDVLGAR